MTNPMQSDDRIRHVCACHQKHPGSCIIQCHNPLTESIPVLYLVTDFSPSDPRKPKAKDTFFLFFK